MQTQHCVNKDYYIINNVPTHEIDKTIIWLRGIRKHYETQIKALEAIKVERARAQAWRDNMNELVEAFKTTEILELNLSEKVVFIRKKLQCNHSRATFIAQRVHLWAEREMLQTRNDQIYFSHLNGTSVTELSKQHDLSRQQIYNVLRQKRGKFMK